jgi:hypothetical protein
MTVPRLTRPSALPLPPSNPRLKKIAFEEHFLVPEALKKNPAVSTRTTSTSMPRTLA